MIFKELELIDWLPINKLMTKGGIKYYLKGYIKPEYEEAFREYIKDKILSFRLTGFNYDKDKGGVFVYKWGNEPSDVMSPTFDKWDNVEIELKSDLPPYDLKQKDGLRNWQIPNVEKLVSSILEHGSALDASDTGSGKTYMAIAVARELGVPFGIVCPKSVIPSWQKVCKNHFNLKPIFISNYEALRTGRNKKTENIFKIETRGKRKIGKWGLPENALIIFDECHKMKSVNSLQAKLGIYARKQGFKILCCSATPSLNPLEMRTLGYILGLHNLNDFYSWISERGCKKSLYGYMFNFHENILKKLHKDVILDRGGRLSRDSIPDFPPCDLIPWEINLDDFDQQKVKEIYSQMEMELRGLKMGMDTNFDKIANKMAILQKALQESELVKIPIIQEMIEDALHENMSVAVFLNFTESIKSLSSRLNTSCIIWGNQNSEDRQKNIDDFQSDSSRIIICNMRAGGVGVNLHDLNGNHPRMSIISPSFSAYDLKQVLGRVWRDGAKTKAIQKIVYISDTPEERICKVIEDKFRNFDLITDGIIMESIFK